MLISGLGSLRIEVGLSGVSQRGERGEGKRV